MSEEKKKAKAETPAAESTADYSQKKKKTAWSVERCKKFARRFHNEQEWQAGSPSSYKAAVARGWVKECASLFKKAPASRPLRKSA